MGDKAVLREKYKRVRASIKNKDELSKEIAFSVLNTSEYINSKVVCVYVSFGGEVSTVDIIKVALEQNKIVGVPITFATHIDFYQINSMKDLKHQNNFGIFEPDSITLINPRDIDLIVVPGICFDLQNNRLGFGRGYYDKYLSQKDLKAYILGICFESQVLLDEFIEVDDLDIKVNRLIYKRMGDIK